MKNLKDLTHNLGKHLNATLPYGIAVKFLCFQQEKETLILHIAGYISEKDHPLINTKIQEWNNTVGTLTFTTKIHPVKGILDYWRALGGWKNGYLFQAIPLLVVYQKTDGSIFGHYGYDPHIQLIDTYFASNFPEPDQARKAVTTKCKTDAPWHNRIIWPQEIKANSLEEALAIVPESPAGQKEILLYKEENAEWLHGIWNNPNKNTHPSMKNLSLHSIANFHGLKVSKKKKDTRNTFDPNSIPYKGDISLLKRAADTTIQEKLDWNKNYEDHQGIKQVCDWWNTNGPADMRHAKNFRLYIWDTDIKQFISCDPEEPATKADAFKNNKSAAVFTKKNSPPVVAVFLKGKNDNIINDFGTQIYDAAGELYWEVGADEYDESWYSFIALKNFSSAITEQNL